MLTDDYVLGLVDGEGSFTVYVKNPDSTNKTIRRVKAEPKFYLKLIEKDKTILYQLQKFFGCGNIYLQKDSRPNHQQCYRYEVSGRTDLENVIIPFFQNNPLRFVSKRNDFELFCKIFRKIKKGEHLTKKGLKEIFKIKRLMH